MTDDLARACPPWCRQPAGHLHVEPDGPGDHHSAQIASLDLPEIPGLRGDAVVTVTVEQYVTATTTHQTVIVLGDGSEPVDSGALTLDEADALASALARAVTAVRSDPGPPKGTPT